MKNIEEFRTKTAESILDRLNDFLPKQFVIELQLAFAIRPSITICGTVTDIMKSYQSTDKNEETVCKLLEKLLQIHFSPLQQETPTNPDNDSDQKE